MKIKQQNITSCVSFPLNIYICYIYMYIYIFQPPFGIFSVVYGLLGRPQTFIFLSGISFYLFAFSSLSQ